MPFSGSIYTRTKTFTAGGGLLPADLNSIEDDLGGQINTVLIKSGINDSTIVRRGKSNIATSESRTNAAYGLLTTPDRVSGIVLPADGLIAIAFQATWQNSVASAGRAALFVGANQVKIQRQVGGGPNTVAVQEATGSATINNDNVLASTAVGLKGVDDTLSQPVDVTTGQIVSIGGVATATTEGGIFYIFAAAGTYDISIQYKSATGSVTAKNRKLWVWTAGF